MIESAYRNLDRKLKGRPDFLPESEYLSPAETAEMVLVARGAPSDQAWRLRDRRVLRVGDRQGTHGHHPGRRFRTRRCPPPGP